MDPFSALTVSCAALQFLDAGGKFISKTYKVYKLADGALQDITDLDAAAERLRSAAKANDVQQYRSSGATASEKGMIALCDECQTFADQLVKELGSLKTSGKSGLWESAKVAFRLDRGKASQNTGQAAASQTLADLQTRDTTSRASIAAGLQQLRTDLTKRLDHHNSQQPMIADVLSHLDNLIVDARGTKDKLNLLQSLCYDGMDVRKEAIHQTHANTYEWIFSSNDQRGETAHLREWLRSGTGIFWVSGKPGSGKSTLMKFIHGHDRTNELLKHWAGQRQIVVASHYFTVNGNDTQKSQAGLLRAICADMARQCPDTFLDIWQHIGRTQSFVTNPWLDNVPQIQWSVSTLRHMLGSIQHTPLRHRDHDLCFVFFIDGLDENSGDHEELTEILQQLTTSSHVKICAASRPWNVFEKAFGSNEDARLYMHHLTQEDVRVFVRDRIGMDEHFQQLIVEDKKAARDIIDSIMRRAEGVFLWVYLVERQVHRSLLAGDGLETLRKRVLDTPADLGAYFKHMFDNLDPFYRADTACIFRMCQSANEYVEQIPLFGFAILCKDDSLASRFVQEDRDREFDEDEILRLERRLRNQILARGQDLLEVSPGLLGRIDVKFMHRTVTDLLMLPEIDSLLQHWSGDTFDVQQSVFDAFALCFRRSRDLLRWGPGTDLRRLPYFYMQSAMNSAGRIEHTQHRTPYTDLNRIWNMAEADPELGLAEKEQGVVELTVLGLALREGVDMFLTQKASAGTVDLSKSAHEGSLLYCAILGDPPSVGMIELLLQHGHGPNDNYQLAYHTTEGTVWAFLLDELTRSPLSISYASYLPICELLIAAGAEEPQRPRDNEGNVFPSDYDGPWSERDILERAFGTSETDRLLALRPESSRDDAVSASVERQVTNIGETRSGLLSRLASLFSRAG